MLLDCIKKLIKRENLTYAESEAALEEIITLNNPEQIAAFLALMRAKGETATEMTAFVRVMQKYQVNLTLDIPLLDIVGTGGDGAQTANISTMASILAASCGVAILKHGNRAVSSQAGSADVLEALGLNLQQTPEAVAQSVLLHRIGFCFAPNFHSCLVKLKPIRQQLKIPTFFNLLGPLLNPGHAHYFLLGVFDLSLQALMADILMQLGVKRAMVVHGQGLDELNCLGPCEVIEINHHQQQKYRLDPQALGLSLCTRNDLIGGDAMHNAQLVHALVNNEPSKLMDTVILNAACAVYLYGKTQSIQEGIALVRAQILNGSAKKTLEGFIHA